MYTTPEYAIVYKNSKKGRNMKRKTWMVAGILALLVLGFLFIKRDSVSRLLARDVTPELAGKQVDIILFMGQSNMSGAGGNAKEAPRVPEGAGYEYKAVTAPEALFSLKEPLGEKEHREGLLDDRELLKRRGTMASAFVNAYYEQTNVPVVAIAASRGSSSMDSWLERLAGDAIDRLEQCRKHLENNQIEIRHCYMVWMQGEADANKETPREEYIADMQTLMDQMETAGVEACFLIQIGNHTQQPGHHTEIQEAQLELCDLDDRIFLTSVLPSQLDDELDEGGVHFSQKALNLIGEDAGRMAGAFARN